MITLADAATALLKRRSINVRHRFTPRTVDDVQPAGAGLAASGPGTGGHSPQDPTSVLLNDAASEIQDLGRMCFAARQPWIEGFAVELRDRAAQFEAVGD